jgi:hypothetical protein
LRVDSNSVSARHFAINAPMLPYSILEGDAMKALFWFGLLVLVLGIASLFVAIPRSEREGIRAGNVDIGVQVKHSEKVSPVVTVILIAGGIGMMIAGGRGRAK